MYASAGADSSYSPEFKPAIFIVRDPICRFKSLYANKALNQGKRTEIEGHREFFDTMPPIDAVIDYIETHDNPHWDPQVEQAEGYTHLLPLHLLSELVPTEPQNTTSSRLVELTLDQMDRLNEMYAQDLILFLDACMSPLAKTLIPPKA